MPHTPRTIVHTPVRRRAPQAPRNTLGSFLLALSVHALLFGALWFAVQWHTVVSDAPAEAELWTIAVPPMVDLTPEPAPPPAPVVVPQQADADIVEKQQKPQPEVPPEPVPPPPPQAKPAPEPVKPVEAVKPPPPKAPPPPEAKRPSDARAQREAEQRRLEEVNRIAAQAGGATAAGSPTRAGAGAGGRGDPSYVGRIQSAVRANIVFSVPDGTSEEISARFLVELLPDGYQAAPPQLLKSSGLPGYDEAVERAIRRTDPFPRPSDGSPPPRTLELTFRPIDRL